MKKYKLLKDLLCFKKGEVHTMDIISISFSPKEAASMCPDSFKDWFEEIKEPSDEEVVAQWIFKDIMGYEQKCFEPTLQLQKHGRRLEPEDFLVLANNLLAKGFKAEWVKECEHEWTLDRRPDAAQFVSTWFCSKCGARK